MTERHILAPLRRWLIDTGSPQLLVPLLLIAVLMIVAALAISTGTQISDSSDMRDIENSGHTSP